MFLKSPSGDAFELYQRAKKYELLLVPCDDFGVTGYVRIAYCVDKQRIVNNFSHIENRRAYELWQRICKKDFREFYDDIIAGKYNLMVCFMIESKAFEAWVEESEEKARSIIDYTK